MSKMKHLSFKFASFLTLFFALTACYDSKFDEQPPLPVEEGDEDQVVDDEASSYNEKYRPLIHYTPSKNWINDPNGLIYVNGVFHMFYQYNPMGNDWGNMSWGHAISKDLIKWEEQPVALTKDELGDIFSGSAVCDVNNTAGFGAGTIVAVYTSSGEHQQQSIAYSTDATTFTKYDNNPVISNNTEADFRDPKVFWYESGQYWVMSLAMGAKHEIQFFKSNDLKSWTKLSSFSMPSVIACNRGIWECPDLLKFNYNSQEKWVLIVSVNPGGPVLGSGTMYFVGNFDGNSFTADNNDYPLWLDYGMDNYAGVTWSNMPDNRTVLIGWMNNWKYAGAVPATPWRSAMTLPRELKLVEYNGKPLLANTVVSEIENIAGDWIDVIGEELGVDGPYQLRLDINLDSDKSFSLANASGEYLEFNIDVVNRKLITMRTGKTGAYDFSNEFSVPSIKSPLNTVGNTVTLDIFVDQSSVEIFTENGSMAQTNLVFPNSIYNMFKCDNENIVAKVRTLQNIWEEK